MGKKSSTQPSPGNYNDQSKMLSPMTRLMSNQSSAGGWSTPQIAQTMNQFRPPTPPQYGMGGSGGVAQQMAQQPQITQQPQVSPRQLMLDTLRNRRMSFRPGNR